MSEGIYHYIIPNSVIERNLADPIDGQRPNIANWNAPVGTYTRSGGTITNLGEPGQSGGITISSNTEGITKAVDNGRKDDI